MGPLGQYSNPLFKSMTKRINQILIGLVIIVIYACSNSSRTTNKNNGFSDTKQNSSPTIDSSSVYVMDTVIYSFMSAISTKYIYKSDHLRLEPIQPKIESCGFLFPGEIK